MKIDKNCREKLLHDSDDYSKVEKIGNMRAENWAENSGSWTTENGDLDDMHEPSSPCSQS